MSVNPLTGRGLQCILCAFGNPQRDEWTLEDAEDTAMLEGLEAREPLTFDPQVEVDDGT